MLHRQAFGPDPRAGRRRWEGLRSFSAPHPLVSGCPASHSATTLLNLGQIAFAGPLGAPVTTALRARLCGGHKKSGPAQGGATSERCSREHLPGAPLSTTIQCASSFLETLHKSCHPHPLRLCPHYIARFPSVKGKPTARAVNKPPIPLDGRAPLPLPSASWSNTSGVS